MSIEPDVSFEHELADGRTLAYDTYGNRAGRPVFYFHAGPGSRLDARLFHDAAYRADLRLIAADRPGIGRSDFQRDRKLADWPADVASLADELGLERFAVMGWSEGGPAALACAFCLPDRVSAAMTIAGTNYGAIDAPEALHQIGPVHRTSARLAPSFSPGLHVMYSALEVMVEHAPSRYASTLRRVVCESDAVTLERDDVVDAVVDSARECFRQGAQGLVHDSLIVHRTWPFDVSAITPPVHFVQGSADTLVPPEVNRPVYDAIPNALWHEYRDEGHFVAVTQAADLFGILAV